MLFHKLMLTITSPPLCFPLICSDIYAWILLNWVDLGWLVWASELSSLPGSCRVPPKTNSFGKMSWILGKTPRFMAIITSTIYLLYILRLRWVKLDDVEIFWVLANQARLLWCVFLSQFDFDVPEPLAWEIGCLKILVEIVCRFMRIVGFVMLGLPELTAVSHSPKSPTS